MFKSKLATLVSLGLFAFSLSAYAVDSKDDLNLGLGGSFACGGGHSSSMDYSTYSFRNINSTGSITIDRIRLFDSNAVVVFDSSVSTLPASFKPTLTANQSTFVNTSELFTTAQSNPMQMHVDWTSVDGTRILALSPAFVRGSNNGGCRMTVLRTR